MFFFSYFRLREAVVFASRGKFPVHRLYKYSKGRRHICDRSQGEKKIHSLNDKLQPMTLKRTLVLKVAEHLKAF